MVSSNRDVYWMAAGVVQCRRDDHFAVREHERLKASKSQNSDLRG